ncbi:MAG: glycine betaine/L-proline ABC transporter ATP-binding protein ProV [Deltaproteobacteria bacterium]|nr:glycine betaine/L-proline ABC transporter ATP-binding protein ProV [Deltaproteobacteria bacterium]
MADKEKIVVKNLYKIFGHHPARAFPLLKKGKTKEEIHAELGLTIGVQDANFSIPEGEIFVIMGLSGSGKSTLVRMFNRLIQPTRGQVLVDGRDIVSMGKAELIKLLRSDMSMVFQSFALMPHMTVLQNAAFGLETAGMPKKERELRALDALEQVGLKPYADSMPRELSGGMQQRVGLARGLAVDPSILLMDEAFSALDPLIRTEMQDELLRLQSEHQRTVVFISHDLDEAMRIGDRIAIMESGRIVQIGTPDEILQDPADEYVKAFFRGVDPTNVLSAGDIARKTQVTAIRHKGEGPRAVLERLNREDRPYAYVLDQKKVYQGIVSVDSLKSVIKDGGEPRFADAFLPGADPVDAAAPLQDLIPLLTAAPWPLPVVDEAGRYLGAISKNIFLKALYRADMPEETTGENPPEANG